MNFTLEIPLNPAEKIPWPTGFADTLRGNFAGRNVSVFIFEDAEVVSEIHEVAEEAGLLEMDPMNYDNFMRLSARMLAAESKLSVIMGNLRVQARNAGIRFKTVHAKTYLRLISSTFEDPEGEDLAVTAAKAKAAALCVAEENRQQEYKTMIELYAPLQEVAVSTKQYLTKALWDLNNQKRGQ